MPGYPTFPKPPESLGRIVVLDSLTGLGFSNASVPTNSATIACTAVIVPFNFDCESGYALVDRFMGTTVTKTATCYLVQGTTTIASFSVSTANALTASKTSLTSVAAPEAKAITIKSGYNQFAAGAVIKVKAKTPAGAKIRGLNIRIVGMKVDQTYGYRA